MSSLDSKQKFETIFPELVDELIELTAETKISKEALEWLKNALLHNTLGGKANRGLSVIDTFKILSGKKELSAEEYKRAAVLGWTVELLQAFFLVADDIMDHSITRRGQPCWYRVPQVGMIAINDAFLLESSIYILLKKYFRSEKYYLDLIELYHEVTYQTELGQLLDLITAPEDKVDLNNFTLEKHSFIVTYKTAYYSFYLPVALAMHLAGIANEADLKQAQDVLLPLGEYFQVQDDYLDCYGDPSVIGKVGTDIADNKCSWLINKALQIATPEQRKVLDENYGQSGEKAEKVVKGVYKDMELERLYLEYEDSIVGDLRKKIEAVDESRGFKKDVLTIFLNKIYKRQK